MLRHTSHHPKTTHTSLVNYFDRWTAGLEPGLHREVS
jgi:hypothetical protein